jgi:hypothetical protein
VIDLADNEARHLALLYRRLRPTLEAAAESGLASLTARLDAGERSNLRALLRKMAPPLVAGG